MSLFIDENLNATKLDFLIRCDINIVTCGIKLKIGLIRYCIVAIYRPHTDNVTDFCNVLSSILTRVTKLRNIKLVLVEDVNVNLLRENDICVIVLCEYLI